MLCGPVIFNYDDLWLFGEFTRICHFYPPWTRKSSEWNIFMPTCICIQVSVIHVGDWHYNVVIMSAMASQITSLVIAYSTVFPRRRSEKTSKFSVTGLCEGNSPVIGEFLAQRVSNAENVSISWRHREQLALALVAVLEPGQRVICNEQLTPYSCHQLILGPCCDHCLWVL